MSPEFLAILLVVLIFSVIVHEVMHGLVALYFGDHTAERAGRLTLNPIPHIDPIGTILLPAALLLPAILSGMSPQFFLAWAKPVPVNPLNFSDLRKGELFVSAAGVLANLSLALIGAIIYHLSNTAFTLPYLNVVALITVNINLLLAAFNLLPIPPLDGSKVLLSQLPYNLAREYQKIEPYGFLILIALLFIRIGDTSIIGIFLEIVVGNLSRLLIGS